MAYAIEYSGDAATHLAGLSARDRVAVLDGVEKHLTHEPKMETRYRKPMRPNNLAPWELRLGQLRVYYDVPDSESKVIVLAVGIKDRNIVRIGGQVIDL
jgi:mRNA-degrading endonuclease RelE of RelBE toxin-antitoxin system